MTSTQITGEKDEEILFLITSDYSNVNQATFATLTPSIVSTGNLGTIFPVLVLRTVTAHYHYVKNEKIGCSE
jgi:hypothetical protein